jgi:hypothetical protein
MLCGRAREEQLRPRLTLPEGGLAEEAVVGSGTSHAAVVAL